MAAARGVVERGRPLAPGLARVARAAAFAVSALTALAGVLTTAPARADLGDDAARLARMWSLSGARVARLPPIFVEHGRPRVVAVPLPPPAPSGAGGRGASGAAGAAGSADAASSAGGAAGAARAAGGADAASSAGGAAGAASSAAGAAGAASSAGGAADADECLTVAVLAPRIVEFTLEAAPLLGDVSAVEALARRLRGQEPEDERRVRSVAGAASMTRCGPLRDELRRVAIDVISPRAAFEIVVAASSGPPERIGAIFPERVFGPVAPRGDPGRPAEPGPLNPRVARAARRARAEGASRVVQTAMDASVVGTGQFSVKLAEGCHRLDLLAEVPRATVRRATDVDAEARDPGSGRVLARDRSDAPDARLDFCLGEPTVVEVPFLGAAGPVKVVLSDAYWPIPAFVPSYFGARARGGLAAALHRRHAPAPRAQAIVEAVGAQGDTLVPVPIEPGRCYFAAAAVVRGDLRVFRISAEVGAIAVRDDAGERGDGAGVAFCSEVEESAAISVAARGSSPVWVVAVWPMD